jgi:hypothetical protein
MDPRWCGGLTRHLALRGCHRGPTWFREGNGRLEGGLTRLAEGRQCSRGATRSGRGRAGPIASRSAGARTHGWTARADADQHVGSHPDGNDVVKSQADPPRDSLACLHFARKRSAVTSQRPADRCTRSSRGDCGSSRTASPSSGVCGRSTSKNWLVSLKRKSRHKADFKCLSCLDYLEREKSSNSRCQPWQTSERRQTVSPGVPRMPPV